MTPNLDRGRFDARLLARLFVNDLDLETALLRPPHIHAQQHRRPVVRFRAAGAGMDFEKAIIAVRFSGKQRGEFGFRGPVGERRQQAGNFSKARFIALFLGHFRKADEIVKFVRNFRDSGQLIMERRALLHQFLRRLRIVPEGRVFRARVQFFEPGLRRIPVKDPSSAVRETA